MGFTFAGLAPLIFVFDMPTSVTFYRGVLGLKLQSSRGREITLIGRGCGEAGRS